MGSQSISGLASSAQASFQAKFAVPIASAAISGALQAHATSSRNPLSAGAQALRSDFSSERVSLNADSRAATTSLLQLGAAQGLFTSLSDTLEELELLAVSAANSSDANARANLNSAFRASLASITSNFADVNSIAGGLTAQASRSNGGDFTIAGLNLLGGGITDVVTQSIRVVSSTSEIPLDGLEFTFEVVQQGSTSNTPGTYTEFNRTGSRAVRGNVIRNFNGANQLDHDISLDVAGAQGTVNFYFNAGDSNEVVRDAINAASDATGVEAFLDGGGNVDLYSVRYGAGETVLVSQVLDGASNHVAGGYDQGQNARFLFTDLQTGASVDVEADGRAFAFTLSGIQFEIDLYTSKGSTGVSLLADQNNLTSGGAVRAFHVEPGGITSPVSGATVAIPELDVGSLGGASGRLFSAELATNPNAALQIVRDTKEQVATPLARISNAIDSVNERIASNSGRLALIDDNEERVSTLSGLIASFESVRQDAERQSSYALLSQISSIFPSAIIPLLDAQR